MDDVPEIMLASEVAALFKVTERTVKAWAANQPTYLGAFRTPGRQWRFVAEEVKAALRGEKGERPRW